MRAAVTILAIVIGLSFVVAVYVRSAGKTTTPATQPIAATQPAQATPGLSAPVTGDPAAPAPGQAVTTSPASTQPLAGTSLGQLTVVGDSTPQSSTLGSDDEQSPYAMKVSLSAWGASIHRITLAQYHDEAQKVTPYVVQTSFPVTASGNQYRYLFASRFITINGQSINLESVAWHLKQPGQYELEILAEGKPIAKLTRHYSLASGKDNYEVLLKQQFENLTGQPLQVVWEQAVQGEQPHDVGSYMNDQRRAFIGYVDPAHDPQRKHVLADGDTIAMHHSVLESVNAGEPFFWPPAKRHGLEMVWFGEANRYFASVVHRPMKATGQGVEPLDARFASIRPEKIESFAPPAATTQPASASATNTATPAVLYVLTSKPMTIAPGQAAELDLALFAGPRDANLFDVQPYKDLGFSHLIRYELSCAFCTFQWLAKGLLGFLKGIHFVLRDWGVAIIILVLVVRIILHPITKKSQIAMTKMGKQMATIQPEMEKIKKKYANDPTKQNQEVMRLYREKGVSPAGMLGCLPMFLQTPIWIALYAMLYFAIELRHEPAFYGIFQTISGGHWSFLADLSSADNFIRFNKSFTLNLYFIHPEFSGINIIPLLMAVFFYMQQALMMPPAANEQQAQQQKIGKWMTLMIPIFLYSAPSGLTLYMLASSIGGMIDGWIVRRHIKQQEEAGTLFETKPRKAPKPGGLWDRMQKAVEAQQQKLADQQKPGGKKPGK